MQLFATKTSTCSQFFNIWVNFSSYINTVFSINQLFAMLLEVILRNIRSIFHQAYVLLHFFAGKGIIYHLIAYDLKIEENYQKFIFWLPW